MIKSIAMALAVATAGHAAVQIIVEADSGRKPISPYLYGKNDGVTTEKNPTTDSVLTLFRDAGLRMLRSNGGNNATKYNWRRKMTSHPDWYNNVYNSADWDDNAKTIQAKLPGVAGMFAFQLAGWAANNTDNNFNDYGYNQSQYWEGVHQNLAGGGTPSASGFNGDKGKTDKPGDYTKYLMPWPADSTAAILPHWFGPGGLGLDSNSFRYWNMDNEVEIWDGTHDDVFPNRITAEEFIQKYIRVAVAVRKHFPGVKLVAPVSPAEWQWYTWNGGLVSYKGKSVSWPEFFIWRLKEAQDSTGVRMLDVYDVHFYPGEMEPADLMQQHRVWFDTSYAFPYANGVHFAEGNWMGDQQKEYFFERINRWLEKYFGPDHGIGLGVSESAIMTKTPDANLSAVWHASFLGTFADHGVEFFTPWSWDVGEWEVTHLFSRKGHSTRVLSHSSLDSLVSAYSSISPQGDSMTIILVNRTLDKSQTVDVKWNGFKATGTATRLQLSNLGTKETFVSEKQNALVSETINLSGNSLNVSLPAKTVTAFQLLKVQTSSSSSSASSSSSTPISSSSVSSSSISSSSSAKSSSSGTVAVISRELTLNLFVRAYSEGVQIMGTDGTEMIEIYDLSGNMRKRSSATAGVTFVACDVSGALFVKVRKGNDLQWNFVPRL